MFKLPEVWVLCDEADGVRFQQSHECAAGALVPIPRFGKSFIRLIERLDRRIRKAEPGRTYGHSCPDGESRPRIGSRFVAGLKLESMSSHP